MRDCQNAKMRDLLPDLLHDRLAADVRAEVQAHAASCADCRAELALLRDVQAAVARRRTPAIDTARVSAGLPPYRARSRWLATSQSWPMRVAAAVVLVAGAATLLRDRGPGMRPDTVVAAATAELSVGALADIEDNDLQSLLDGMAKLEAVTPSEPEVFVVPAVERGNRSEP